MTAIGNDGFKRTGWRLGLISGKFSEVHPVPKNGRASD
jgi:hypothetical protein